VIRLSVIMPCYNARATLPRALAALADQDLAPEVFEVIVVDDGSTDGSAEAAEALRPPIALRVVRQANRGIAATRNLGVAHARGQVFLFLDADVFARPALLAAHLRHYPDGAARLAVQGVTFADPQTLTTPFMRTSNLMPDFTHRSRSNLAPQLVTGRNFSVSRAAFDAAGGFDDGFRGYGLEDVEFAFRLRRAGAIIEYEPDAIGVHHHPLSIEAAVARQRQNGRAAVRLWRKHGRSLRLGLHYEVHPALLPLKWVVFRTGLVTRLLTAIRPWAEQGRHDLILNEVYSHLLWQGYHEGVLAALRDGEQERAR
jgi:glycosyltransferase involved in cell wall biosynthesis